MALVDGLGLDDISADVNSVPDNTYDCVVSDVDYVWSEPKNRLSHVITYSVEGGQFNGRRIQHWFGLGADATFDANGKPNGYRPTMTEGQKSWYKKAFVDLGIPEDGVTQMLRESDGKAVIGRKCSVKVAKNPKDTRYQNVTGVTLRSGSDTPAPMSPTSSDAPKAAPEAPATDLASQL